MYMVLTMRFIYMQRPLSMHISVGNDWRVRLWLIHSGSLHVINNNMIVEICKKLY
jgi:hypothetical protein